MKKSILSFIAFLILYSSVPAVSKKAEDNSCGWDGAVYLPNSTSGDGDYELIVEQNDNTSDWHKTGIIGGEVRRFHLNLHDPKTHELVTTATLSHVCTANGVIYCYTLMDGLKNMSVVFLDKDFKQRFQGAPYAIIFPNIASNFYYGYKEPDNPSMKFYHGDKYRIVLPPEVYIRQKCGVSEKTK
jgi:hypothetical protein